MQTNKSPVLIFRTVFFWRDISDSDSGRDLDESEFQDLTWGHSLINIEFYFIVLS